MNISRNIAKMMTPTEQIIGRNTFYIYPLPAFVAANLSTEVINLLAPLVGGIAEAFKESDKGEDTNEKKGLMDMDISEAAPHIAAAFSSLQAEKMDRLLRKLIMSENVAVCKEGSTEAAYMTEDLCNEVFCGNVQDMFVLAFYSIKVNYRDFFEKIGNQSGNVKAAVMKIVSPDTEGST